MIDDFINYAFYGDVIGKSVDMTEKLYHVYCKLFNVDEVDNISNRICNEYDLFIVKGKFEK